MKARSGIRINFEACLALEDTDGLQNMAGVGLMRCKNLTLLQGLSGRPELVSGMSYQMENRKYTVPRRGISWELLGSSDGYLSGVLGLSDNQNLTSLASLGSTPWPKVQALLLDSAALSGRSRTAIMLDAALTRGGRAFACDFVRAWLRARVPWLRGVWAAWRASWRNPAETV